MKNIKRETKVFLKVNVKLPNGDYELIDVIELEPKDYVLRETVVVLVKDPVSIIKREYHGKGAYLLLKDKKSDVVFQTLLERTYKKQWFENSIWGEVKPL